MWFQASVTGRPCHVLQTSAGSNAIEVAFELFSSALKKLKERYNQPKGNVHPAYRGIEHPVNFNLGIISGGNWASSVPSSCWFEARVGFIPGVTIDMVKQDIETTLHEAANKLGLGLEISYRGFHADGAVLLPQYLYGKEGSQDDSHDKNKHSLQKDFVGTIQTCYRCASSEDAINKKPELGLKPLTCTCDARFYPSL